MKYPVSQLAFVEDGLQLPCGSILAMVGPDDWAMVLKLHAVIEAVVNVVIAAATGDAIEKVAEGRIGQTNGRGKARQVYQLKALSPLTAAMLDALTSIRNEYAHNPRYVLLPIRDVVLQSRYRATIDAGLPMLPFMAGDDREYRSRVVIAAMWVLATLVRALLKIEPDGDCDAEIRAAFKPDAPER